MNSNFISFDEAQRYDALRSAEETHRAARLRADWYTREALHAYLRYCTPLHVSRENLLAPYDYLANVPEADFQWGTAVRACD